MTPLSIALSALSVLPGMWNWQKSSDAQSAMSPSSAMSAATEEPTLAGTHLLQILTEVLSAAVTGSISAKGKPKN